MNQSPKYVISPLQRIRLWQMVLILISAVFIIRAFYLQVLRHDYYQNLAITKQLKEYQIPAERGLIYAKSGDKLVPLVLNEYKYTLFADPVYVKDAGDAATKIAAIIGGNKDEYEQKIRTPDTRYVILAKKLDKSQREKIDNLKLKGIVTTAVPYRTYPHGNLASQLLGFVNDEGEGKYGLEQALDKELHGTPGELRAITDVQGVPLATNKDNVITEPKSGEKLELTIDLGMQRQLEDILKTGLDNARSSSGSALILDMKGGVKAMANYPTYDPADFSKVEDASLFTNASVSSPLEVGSIMKPLTAAAALDLRVVNKDSTYYDPSQYRVDDAVVRNIEEDGGPGTKSVTDILQLSLNTGATWLLMQMGGGEINEQGRLRWYDYMVNHYHLDKPTGIEQGYEPGGNIPSPTDGYGLNIQYANSSFGQGMTATPLQMGAAFVAVLNGGTYYQPHLIDKKILGDGSEVAVEPKILSNEVVKPDVSQTIKDMMEYSLSKNYLGYSIPKPRGEFSLGGKTGTAQVPKPEGGYYDDRYNGMFVGFVGGDSPQYLIVVRVNEPKIGGYAGAKAAAPIFGSLSTMLIDNFGVTPRTR